MILTHSYLLEHENVSLWAALCLLRFVYYSMSLSYAVLSSLTSAGPSHFGALGTNWGHPPPAVPSHFLPPQPHFAPSTSLLHTPDLSTSSLTSSAQKRPFAPMSNHLHPQAPVRNHAISPLLPTPTTTGQSRQQVDDGDELGEIVNR